MMEEKARQVNELHDTFAKWKRRGPLPIVHTEVCRLVGALIEVASFHYRLRHWSHPDCSKCARQ